MDTKLKRFNGSKGMKIMASILCVIFFVGSLLGIGLLTTSSNASNSRMNIEIEDILFSDNYKESMAFQREFAQKLDTALYILQEYKNEEFIKSGKTISEEELESAIEELFYEKVNSGVFGDEVYDDEDLTDAARTRFLEDYQGEIALLKERLIMNELRDMNIHYGGLSDEKGFNYYVTDGVNTLTNLEDSGSTIYATQFNTKPAYLIYENDAFTKVPASSENFNEWVRQYDRDFEWRLENEYNRDLKVYLSFDASYLSEKEHNFSQLRSDVLRWIPISLACIVITLATFIYLLVTTGRKDEEGNRPTHRIDNVFTEVQLTIIALCLFGGGAAFLSVLYEGIRYGVSFNGNSFIGGSSVAINIAIAAIIGLAAAGLGLLFILSCIRNAKAGRFLKNSLIVKIVLAIWNGITGIYHGGSVMAKVILVTLGISLLSASVVGAPIVILLIVIFAPRWVKKYDQIKKGVEEVRNGNLSYKIPLEGKGELSDLARSINEISQASNIAVQNELKNQRLKTDLISNVSHDLKTPLTSIITYIDLLKIEGIGSENAPKYLEILDQKSQRLKKLTEDLFDAAKASSGAIPVNLEKVEMLSLINQSLGEMADRIEASGLEFKINAQKEKYYVNGDGQLLWRVMENLLGNVLKYALEGSRVYIDLKERGSVHGGVNGAEAEGLMIMEIKNISDMALNINEEELMERFKRGDDARATEGSGLGLAIAKDLIRLQNGWFEIKIDGDLFKAVIMLPGIQ